MYSLQVPATGDKGKGVFEIFTTSSRTMEKLKMSFKAHQQLAIRLNMSTYCYFRLLQDHPDAITTQVNNLFIGKPHLRRCLISEETISSFLSDDREV